MRTARLETEPYMLQFQWPPPGVALAGVGVIPGPQMNKFEQVSSDHHQMSLPRGGVPRSVVWGRGYPTMWPIP